MKRLFSKGKNFVKNLVTTDSAFLVNEKFDLPHKILVGTHHKTGTVWMHSIFNDVCEELGLKYYHGDQKDLPRKFDVFMQNHSRFDLSKLSKNYRGLHIIRDPRDRIVSGTFYHQKSKEEWLHIPRKHFDGMTYQEIIKGFENFDDKLLFEMEHSGKHGIHEMLSWNYENPDFINIKYEDLIVDEDLFLFHKIFNFLGFPGSVIPTVLQCAYNNSLFSGKVEKSVHVRSGSSNQWKKYFKQKHKDRFVELFGDALITLGYEEDNNWAEESS